MVVAPPAESTAADTSVGMSASAVGTEAMGKPVVAEAKEGPEGTRSTEVQSTEARLYAVAMREHRGPFRGEG